MTEEEKRLVMSRILTGRKPEGPYSMPSSTFESIYEEYPRLRSGDYRLVVDPELMGGQGDIEFIGAGYSADPKGVPVSLPAINEDNPTIALRSLESNPNLQRRLLGDMLHNLPETDEKFSEMKQGFIKSMTPEQIALDKKVYKEATMPEGTVVNSDLEPSYGGRKLKHAYGEDRSYEDWFDRSRSDAHIRGYIAPDKDDEWKDTYTDEQEIILNNMIRYLKEEEEE
tara:strand:+ start:48 stop:725 length:678 start_codon:yes stop_codon:yes gene_type:complete